jgi:hypothetical protein
LSKIISPFLHRRSKPAIFSIYSQTLPEDISKSPGGLNDFDLWN